MLLGLSSSGKVTRLNIVINPFKKSHCPVSPLRVCKRTFVVTADIDCTKVKAPNPAC